MTDNKRDLFTDGFTESDFEFGTHSGQMLVAKIMMDKSNAILREALEQAQTLNGTVGSEGSSWCSYPRGTFIQESYTHTGKLVAVKKVGE